MFLLETSFYFDVSFGVLLTAISILSTFLVLRYLGIDDQENERSSHNGSVPKCGGISIVLTFLLGMVFINMFIGPGDTKPTNIYGFIFAALFIAFISFVDDIFEVNALIRLLTQLIAVAILILCDFVIDTLSIPFVETLELGYLGIALTIIWVLGMTNACNFMDGIDGLVASNVAITLLFFMTINYYAGSTYIYIVCYALIAGTIGFLVFNAPPARIFMGDVGSAFLGFVLAAMAVMATHYDTARVSFLVMPMLMFHFIFDTVFTLTRRILNRQNPLKPHCGHLYQLLIRSGFSHLEVTLLLSCMTFLQGLGALWLMNIPGDQRAFVFIPFLLIQCSYAFLTLRYATCKGVRGYQREKKSTSAE